MPYIGARLKAARAARKMTQDVLSELTGIRRTDISAIERDQKPAGAQRLEKFAAALQISVLELSPEAEADAPGLLLQDHQAKLEAQVLELTNKLTRLTRRVRALERREPPGSPEAGTAAN